MANDQWGWAEYAGAGERSLDTQAHWDLEIGHWSFE
jgi:hypothetical protein